MKNMAIPDSPRLLPFTVVLLLAVILLAPQPAQAQLQRVEQTVFGMDCAPCAYALEKRMNQLDGIESASVSLNEGRATLDLAPDNRVTLEQVRRAVQEAGFSAEDATVRVAGTLAYEDGRPMLVLPSDERFHLQEDDATTDALNEAEADTRIHVTGHVSEGEAPPAEGWTLHVQDVETHS